MLRDATVLGGTGGTGAFVVERLCRVLASGPQSFGLQHLQQSQFCSRLLHLQRQGRVYKE